MERILHNTPFWKSFRIVDLPKLHSDQVDDFLDATSEKFSTISFDNNAKRIIAQRNDGTFASIIIYITTENALGSTVVSEEMAQTSFTGVYRNYLEASVYIPFIKPFPGRIHTLSALTPMLFTLAPMDQDNGHQVTFGRNMLYSWPLK